MRMLKLLAALSLCLAVSLPIDQPLHAAGAIGDGICETTSTAGTGTVNLAGAVSGGYSTFVSQIASGSDVPYRISTGTGASRKIEDGVGVFTDGAPDTLTRNATHTTDDDAAPIDELTLAGTSTVCLAVNKSMLVTGGFGIVADAGDSATAFFSAGTVDDARVDGSAESDEVTLAGDVDGAANANDIDEAAVEAELESVIDLADLGDNYVASVADGTGIDGTASGVGATYTPTLDLTEINTATWGVNNYTTMVFSTDGVDLTWDYSTTDGVAMLSGGGTSPSLALDDQGQISFYEEDANGANSLGIRAPAAVTSGQQCTLEDDASFIPDTCVGNGTDDNDIDDVPEVGDFGALVGGSGIDNNSGTLDFDATEISSLTWGAGSFTTEVFNAGATDPTWTYGSGIVDLSNITSRFSISGGGNVLINATTAYGSAAFEVNSTSASNNSFNRWVASAAGVTFSGNKSRGATAGTFDIVADGDTLTQLVGNGADEAEFNTGGVVAIKVDGTPSDPGPDMPGRIELMTSPDGSATSTARMVVKSDGGIIVGPNDTSPGAGNFLIDAEGNLLFGEAEANGDNSLGFQAPAAVTTTQTCTLEDDASFIPDSCVGDGSDDDVPEVADFSALVGGSGIDNNSGTLDFDATELTSFVIGASLSVFDAGADAAITPALQVAGLTGANGALGVSRFSASGEPRIMFLRSLGTTLGDFTIVTNGTNLGELSWAGADGSDAAIGAKILASVDGTPGNGDMPTRLSVSLTADGANDTTERFVWKSDGAVILGNDDALTGIGLHIDDNAFLRIYEADANGDNYVEFITSASIGTNRQCVLVDAAAPIPDSCVGDGTDAGGTDTLGPDGDKGDITVGGTGTTLAYDADSVTYADIQNVVNDERILGRISGAAGDIEELTDAQAVVFMCGADPAADRIAFWDDSAGTCEWLTAAAPLTISTTTIDVSAATESADGSVELATTAEADTGTDTTRAVTSAGVLAAVVGRNTIWVPAASMIPNVTSGAAPGTYDSGSNDLTVPVLDYDTGATEERADFQIAMPKNWDESTLIYQILWTNASGASSSVAWEVGCAAVSDDDTLNATMGTTVIVVDAWIATNDLHIAAESAALTCGGTPAENDMLSFRVSRDTSNASDAMAGDARLIGIKIYYTTNNENDD